MDDFSFESTLDFNQYSLSEKIKLAETGIAKKQLKNLCDILGVTIGVLAKVLDVHERTLYIKKASELCNRNITNDIFGIIEIYSTAYSLFSSQASANSWLNRKQHLWGNKAPVDFAQTSPGRQVIKNELMRLRVGGPY